MPFVSGVGELFRHNGANLGLVHYRFNIGSDGKVDGSIEQPHPPPSALQDWLPSGPNDPEHLLCLKDGGWVSFHVVCTDGRISNGRVAPPPKWSDTSPS